MFVKYPSQLTISDVPYPQLYLSFHKKHNNMINNRLKKTTSLIVDLLPLLSTATFFDARQSIAVAKLSTRCNFSRRV